MIKKIEFVLNDLFISRSADRTKWNELTSNIAIIDYLLNTVNNNWKKSYHSWTVTCVFEQRTIELVHRIAMINNDKQ